MFRPRRLFAELRWVDTPGPAIGFWLILASLLLCIETGALYLMLAILPTIAKVIGGLPAARVLVMVATSAFWKVARWWRAAAWWGVLRVLGHRTPLLRLLPALAYAYCFQLLRWTVDMLLSVLFPLLSWEEPNAVEWVLAVRQFGLVAGVALDLGDVLWQAMAIAGLTRATMGTSLAAGVLVYGLGWLPSLARLLQ